MEGELWVTFREHLADWDPEGGSGEARNLPWNFMCWVQALRGALRMAGGRPETDLCRVH